jgi:hypothetical protein
MGIDEALIAREVPMRAQIVSLSVIRFVVEADHAATVYVAHVGLAPLTKSTLTHVARLANFY